MPRPLQSAYQNLLIVILFAVALTTAPLYLSAWSSKSLNRINANNDHGFWLEQNIEGKLSTDWTLKFHAEQHWGSDYKIFFHHEYEVIFQYDLKRLFGLCENGPIKTFLFGPGYNELCVIQKNTYGNFHWVSVNRPMLQADFNIEVKEWKVNQRMRGEYFGYTRRYYKDHAIYRHRLVLHTPWKFTCLKINPYISNEWFLRCNSYHKTSPKGLVGGYYHNRFRVGCNSEFLDGSLVLTTYWQLLSFKQKPGTHPSWANSYQYGVVTSFYY